MMLLRENLIFLVRIAFEVYFWLILLRVIFSWIGPPRNRILYRLYEFVYDITEPLLSAIRRVVPVLGAGGVGIDFSPIIAIFLLRLAERAVITVISIVF